MIRNILVVLLFCLSLGAHSATTNFTAFFGTWNSGGNWSAGIPGPGDRAIVDAGTSFRFAQLGTSVSVKTLVIRASSGGTAEVQFTSSGNTITVTDSIIIEGDGTATLNINQTNSNIICGGVIVIAGVSKGNARINNSAGNCTIETENLVFNTTGTIDINQVTSSFIFTGSGNIDFYCRSTASIDTKYGNVIFNKSGGTVTLQDNLSDASSPTFGNFSGFLKILGSTTFDSNNFSVSGGSRGSNNPSDSLVIANGTTVTLSGGNFPEFTSYRTGTDYTLNLSSGSAQNLGYTGKTLTFGNVNISGGQTVSTIGTRNDIYGIVSISNSSTLNAGGRIRIVSNANGTAAIGEIGAGSSVSGNVQVHRYVSDMSAAGNPGWWYFLGAPVSGQSVASINDDISTTGFTGSDFPSSSFNSVQKWDFGSGAYLGATSTGDGMSVGEGWFVYMGSNDPTFDIPATIDFTGSITSGDYSGFTISSTLDDYSPLANPYPSAVVFDLTAMPNSNIADPYVVQPDGSFAALTNGSTIGLAEGFFVRSTGGAASLTFRESDKLGSVEANSVFNKAGNASANQNKAPKLQVEITKTNGIIDYSYLQLDDSKTVGMDYPADFSKLENINGFTNIYFETSGRNAHINNIPSNLNGTVSFPIGINRITSFNQNVTLPFAIKGVEDFKKANICVQLENTATGQITTLDKDYSATIQWYDTAAATPYILHLSNGFDQSATAASCYGEEDGNIVATPSAAGTYNYYLTSIVGDTLESAMNQTGASYSFNNLSAGTYQVILDDMGAACGVLSEKVEVTEPEAVVSFFTVPTNQLDLANDGMIAFNNVSGNSSSYYWDFGDGNTSTQKDPIHTYTSTGEFEVSLVALQGVCSDTSSKTLKVTDSQVSVEEVNAVEEVTLLQRNEHIQLKFDLEQQENITVRLTNLLGQEVFASPTLQQKDGTYELALPVAQQVYLLSVKGESFETSYKLIRR